jgi:hypothetical protein
MPDVTFDKTFRAGCSGQRSLSLPDLPAWIGFRPVPGEAGWVRSPLNSLTGGGHPFAPGGAHAPAGPSVAPTGTSRNPPGFSSSGRSVRRTPDHRSSQVEDASHLLLLRLPCGHPSQAPRAAAPVKDLRSSPTPVFQTVVPRSLTASQAPVHGIVDLRASVAPRIAIGDGPDDRSSSTGGAWATVRRNSWSTEDAVAPLYLYSWIIRRNRKLSCLDPT